jgi:hypothetical protein
MLVEVLKTFEIYLH